MGATRCVGWPGVDEALVMFVLAFVLPTATNAQHMQGGGAVGAHTGGARQQR